MDIINKSTLEKLQAELEEKEIAEGLDTHELSVLFVSYLCFDLTSAKQLWKRIPQSSKGYELFIMLKNVYKNLYTEQYEEFFKSLYQEWKPEILPYVEYLARTIRHQNLWLLSNYDNLPISKFCSMLGLTEEDATTSLKKIDWELNDGKIITKAVMPFNFEDEPSSEELFPSLCSIALGIQKDVNQSALPFKSNKRTKSSTKYFGLD